MRFKLRDLAAATVCTLAAAGIAYTAAEIVALRRFRERKAEPVRGTLPPVTILKPLHGAEPELYENLRSFCEQAYPQFQVIFGARDPADPALEIARRLAREFPDADLRIVDGGSADRAANPKIANVSAMMADAKYDLLAIVDSDIHVAPGYLATLASVFSDPAVGAATCLYAGIPLEGSAPAIGAAIVNERFMPSVLVAMMIEPLEYCFGSTMAVRRNVLEKIGGLAALGAGIGDDFTLGKLVSEAGYRVALCPTVVQMTVSDSDLSELWVHQLRWQRTVLAARPRGFAGSLVTHVLPLAALSAILCRSKTLGGLLFGAAFALRVAVQSEASKTLALKTRPSAWLIAAADAIAFGTWVAAFFSGDVTWRNRKFTIAPGGRLSDDTSSSWC